MIGRSLAACLLPITGASVFAPPNRLFGAQTLTGDRARLTPGVAALGQAAVDRIVKTIAVFDDFCQANDPYGEHDFGVFEAEGHTIFFKIDYLDTTLTYHSPDPADPGVTERVLTIMLAEEY